MGFMYIVHNFILERFIIAAAACRAARTCYEEALKHSLHLLGLRDIERPPRQIDGAGAEQPAECTPELASGAGYGDRRGWGRRHVHQSWSTRERPAGDTDRSYFSCWPRGPPVGRV